MHLCLRQVTLMCHCEQRKTMEFGKMISIFCNISQEFLLERP